MLVIEDDVYVCKIQGDITVCVCLQCVSVQVFTCDLVQTLSSDVIVLVHPLSVTFEVDLGGGWRPAAQLDWTVLHYESILGF